MMPSVSLAHLCQVVFSLEKDLKGGVNFRECFGLSPMCPSRVEGAMSLPLKFRNHLPGDEYAGVKDIHGILLSYIGTPAG